ncbi:MAG TPA: DUF5691 domain-containing protein, partial [Phycisphaerales bacterium]|nr:DUF5691 domain-containing protein [Phycisphaerales bacterium]
LVASSWKADGADERRKFVEVLGEGATVADEPFLEAALDDRSKLVRQAAARALSLVDGSRLVARVEGIVKGAVRVEESKKGLLRKTVRTLAIEPPKAWDKGWERDGLEEKPAGKIGQRAWWLQQALALYGPRRLAALLAMDYAALLEALREHEYGDEVVGGLREWAPARQDAEWLVALAEFELKNEKTPTMGVLQLLHGVPVETAERVAGIVMQRRGFSMSDVGGMCNAVAGPWSAKFTKAVADQIADVSGKKSENTWWAGEVVQVVTVKGAVAAAGAVEKAIEGLGDEINSQPRVRASLDRLRLRQDMHKEFAR